jgi:hypothetical protein
LPDGVRRGEIVYDPKDGSELINARALDLPITNKEQRLIEIVKEEEARQEMCYLCGTYWHTRPIARLGG